jgi:hypothetical protein
VTEDTNSEGAEVMAVMVVTEDRPLDSEQALKEAMEAMEATVMDSWVLPVALAVNRDVGHSSARASCAIVNTKNRVGAPTSSRVVVAVVAIIEAHISPILTITMSLSYSRKAPTTPRSLKPS